MKTIVLALALAVAGAHADHGQLGVAQAHEEPLVAEARLFMDAYARDLIAGNRTAVSDRYDRRGAYVVVGGTAKLESHADIAAIYAGPQWSALPRFQWHDLNYVPAGPEGIVVALFEQRG